MKMNILTTLVLLGLANNISAVAIRGQNTLDKMRKICIYETFKTCEDVMRGNGYIPGLLDVRDLYDVEVSGEYSLFFAFINPSDSSMTFERTYMEGLQQTQSTTISQEWSVNVGVEAYGAAVNAGYQQSIQRYSSTTWTQSTEHKYTINVPPSGSTTINQRIIKISFRRKALNGNVSCQNNRCLAVSFNPNNRWLTGDCAWDSSLPKPTWACDFDTSLVTFRFATNCFTSETDPVKREQSCPL